MAHNKHKNNKQKISGCAGIIIVMLALGKTEAGGLGILGYKMKSCLKTKENNNRAGDVVGLVEYLPGRVKPRWDPQHYTNRIPLEYKYSVRFMVN